MPGYLNAYGGVLAGQAYGEVRGNTRPHGVGIPADARLVAGGAAWAGETPVCAYPMAKTGFPCEQAVLPDTDHCLGHGSAAAKAEKLREGK